MVVSTNRSSEKSTTQLLVLLPLAAADRTACCRNLCLLFLVVSADFLRVLWLLRVIKHLARQNTRLSIFRQPRIVVPNDPRSYEGDRLSEEK